MIDLEAAALVRGGDERQVTRLCRLGGRIIERGEYLDGEGTAWPVAVVQIGGQRGPVIQVFLEPMEPSAVGPADATGQISGVAHI